MHDRPTVYSFQKLKKIMNYKAKETGVETKPWYVKFAGIVLLLLAVAAFLFPKQATALWHSMQGGEKVVAADYQPNFEPSQPRPPQERVTDVITKISNGDYLDPEDLECFRVAPVAELGHVYIYFNQIMVAA